MQVEAYGPSPSLNHTSLAIDAKEPSTRNLQLQKARIFEELKRISSQSRFFQALFKNLHSAASNPKQAARSF
jgi:hypothetical protein